jgi:hypothetical protein
VVVESQRSAAGTAQAVIGGTRRNPACRLAPGTRRRHERRPRHDQERAPLNRTPLSTWTPLSGIPYGRAAVTDGEPEQVELADTPHF